MNYSKNQFFKLNEEKYIKIYTNSNYINMLKYLILALVITLILSLIFWVLFDNRDSRKRKKSERLLQSSSGIFDENAHAALDLLTQINNPGPDDYFRRGDIMYYNVREGNIYGGRGENVRARRARRSAVDHIVRDYTDALLGMRGRVAHVGDDRNLGPDFMVHRIEDFGQNLPNADDDIEIQRILFGFRDTINTHVPVVRKEIIQERRNRAVTDATTRSEAIDKYFDLSTRFTNDAQNVHDSKVNSDLRETLRRLKSTAPNKNAHTAIDEARKYIETVYATRDNRQKVQNALSVLENVSRGERISTFNDSEDNIFAYTWSRCDHPRNRERSELMREAIVDALADSVENGGQVCINGRCGRILNSLVTLDYDQEVSNGAMTFEAYKNQIFQETKEIINQEIVRAKNSGNEKLRTVGESYDGVDIETDPLVEEQFKNEIKQEIDRNMEKYDSKLSADEINKLRQECYVYATI